MLSNYSYELVYEVINKFVEAYINEKLVFKL
ncbi:hypothetical protein F889_01217 [Acinetobacter colistiniresistens]|uniref:Uncharacterized protein n=1 Tax=Acinetobacter colistiniresistens TaxID=280145 RepID=N9PQ31_9GAMM|nr:hypothetical protein F889_01217 [Acinetobacter colistiniresistens]